MKIKLLGGKEIELVDKVNKVDLIFKDEFRIHDDVEITELSYDDLIALATGILKIAEEIQ